jgi:IS4 transposase
MLSQMVLEQLEKKWGEAVMVRAVMENVLSTELVEGLFDQHRGRQYRRDLLFSTLVGLMGLVVCRVRSSLHKAYTEAGRSIAVSVKSVYNKMNGTRVALSQSLVSASYDRMSPVVNELHVRQPLIPGYQTRLVDGNHLAATEHRLAPLRTVSGGALPGVAVVVYDRERQLVAEVDYSADAYTQERQIVLETLGRATAGQVWIADRNFCTSAVLFQLNHVGAGFIIRRHAKNVRFRKVGSERAVGRTDTGMVYETDIVIESDVGEEISARVVRVVLDQPTRDKETEIELLTNLPASIGAIVIAEAYRCRWDLEVAFADLEKLFQGEIESLGHPQAALLAFSLAVVAYNALSVVRAAMCKVHGVQKVEEEVSSYHMATRVQMAWGATETFAESRDWTEKFSPMTPRELANYLCRVCGMLDLKKIKKSKRGPKKPGPQRVGTKPHFSTQRLLDAAR